MKVVRDLVADPISGAPRDITICSTIHSPTPYCFSLFDRMLLLLRGQVVYFGQHGARLLREVPFPADEPPCTPSARSRTTARAARASGPSTDYAGIGLCKRSTGRGSTCCDCLAFCSDREVAVLYFSIDLQPPNSAAELLRFPGRAWLATADCGPSLPQAAAPWSTSRPTTPQRRG